MMPSMPRLSTPARSHKSSPSVPRISGVAIRTAAAQKAAESRISSTPSIASGPAQAVAGDEAREQHSEQGGRDDQVGEIAGHAERPAHAVGADEHGGHE